MSRRDYAGRARVELLNECLEQARQVLPHVTRPRDFLYFAAAIAILIEKRRLEDGPATGRAEARVSRSAVRLTRPADAAVQSNRRIDLSRLH